jgi:cyclopropane fatty-acyl-phospholipid synthase-like methyltransferase
MTIQETKKTSAGVPHSLRSKPYRTKEDVTNFWLEAGKIYADTIDCKIYKHQEINFLEIIQKELDLKKLETVLDIGVGYGRLAKIILDNSPRIKQYDGIDISQDQLDRSFDYIRELGPHIYSGLRFDFEDIVIDNWPKYDLVISTEFMTCLPYSVKSVVNKMIAMSKKYVVNLDHYTNPRQKSLEDNVLRNWHDYPKHYNESKGVVHLKGISIPEYSQELFVARVK